MFNFQKRGANINIHNLQHANTAIKGKEFHLYEITGHINGESFAFRGFTTRREAENFLFSSILEEYNIDVVTNEFTEKHVNEISGSNNSHFTISRIQ